MIRFGLIGYGAIGQVRAHAVRQTPGAELNLIVEPVDARRDQAARAGFPVARSIEELIEQKEIDVVIVSTPPNLHRAHCDQVLRAGKDVLCEKPLASTVEDCRSIVATAQQCGRVLGTGFNYRFYPAVVQARELIAAGKIGAVNHVKSFAGHPGGPEFTHQWVHDPKIMGGGALMDNGIHLADLTLHFLGSVTETFGLRSERVWNFAGSEDNGYVLMRTQDGRIGTLHASWSEWSGYHFDVEISGTHGCIRLHYPPMWTLLYDRPNGSARRGRRTIFTFPKFQILERVRSYRWTIVESFIAEHLDFIARRAGKPGVGATGEDGLRAVELAYSAYAPAQVKECE